MVEISKTFICHYSPLIERRKFQQEQITKLGIKAEFITEFDKEYLVKTDVQKISDAEYSLFMKHIFAYDLCLYLQYPYTLILEDDAILVDNFWEKLNQIEINDFDFLFIGSAGSRPIRNNENPRIFEKDESRCTDSYIISYNCVKKILFNNPLPELPIDHFLTKKIRELKLKTFHLEPGLAFQGSQHGHFSSSIR